MMKIAAPELLGLGRVQPAGPSSPSRKSPLLFSRRSRRGECRRIALLILGVALPAFPLLGETPVRVPVATTRHFVFYSDFEPNLNDALIEAGVARRFRKPELFKAGPETGCFAKLPEPVRAGWDGAADFYARIVSPSGSNSTQRFLIRAQIAGFDDELRDDADRQLAAIARGFRAAAGPAYRACRWAAQDEANRRWIEELKPRLIADEGKIGPRLEALYGREWAAEPIPVDVVQTVDFSGANTILRDPGRGHVLISIENPQRAAVEVVFHEASHILMGGGAPVRQALDDAARAAGYPLPGDLWHVVLFYTTGEVVRGILDEGHAPAYTPMLYEIYDRGTWGEYRQPLESAWKPYVDGTRTLPEAAAALIDAIRTSPPPRPQP